MYPPIPLLFPSLPQNYFQAKFHFSVSFLSLYILLLLHFYKTKRVAHVGATDTYLPLFSISFSLCMFSLFHSISFHWQNFNPLGSVAMYKPENLKKKKFSLQTRATLNSFLVWEGRGQNNTG